MPLLWWLMRDNDVKTANAAADARRNGMKRKPNPEKTDRENPAWSKETFKRARPAREVLRKLVGDAAAKRMLKPRGRLTYHTKMRSFLSVSALILFSTQLVASVTSEELLRYEKFGIENPLTGKVSPLQSRTKHFAEVLLRESPEALNPERNRGALFLARNHIAGKRQINQLYVTPTRVWHIVCDNSLCQNQPASYPKQDSPLLAAYNALQLLGKGTTDFKGITLLMITEDTNHNESSARRMFGENGKLVYEGGLVFWETQ